MIQISVNIKNHRITNQALNVALGVLDDGKYQIEITEITNRSIPQNKYYWKVIVPAVKDGLRHAGWEEIKSNEDAHEFIKLMFLTKILINKSTGECKEITGSTASLTTKEFIAFMEEVIKWGAEFLGLQIPFPNEVILAKYDEQVKATIIE